MPSEQELTSAVLADKSGKQANAYLSRLTTKDRPAESFLELHLAIAEQGNSGRSTRGRHQPTKKAPGVPLERNVRLLGSAFLRELLRAEFDIESTMLHEIVYQQTFESMTDVASAVARELHMMQPSIQGILVVPLLNVGIRMSLLDQFAARSAGPAAHPTLVRAGRWALLTPTRSVDNTREQLNVIAPQLGLVSPLSQDALDRFVTRYRPEWLTRNPLLLVALPATTGDRTDNAAVLLDSARRALTELTILAAADPSWEHDVAVGDSTRSMGERALRHLDHMFVLSSGESGEALVAPHTIGAARAWQEQVDVGADIPSVVVQKLANPNDTEVLSLVSLRSEERRRDPVLRGPDAQKAGWETLRKWNMAASLFRRSLQTHDDPWVSRISLCSAFELLLLDHQVGGIATVLQARTSALLQKHSDGETLAAAVRRLYRARNLAVHQGSTSEPVDLRQAQRAFALCFLQLAARSTEVGTVDKPLEHFTKIRAKRRGGRFTRAWQALQGR